MSRVCVHVATATGRHRRSVLELIQAHAFAAHCQVALTETHGVVVRWVDGIVTGSTEQVEQFLTTVRPVLARCHGMATAPLAIPAAVAPSLAA